MVSKRGRVFVCQAVAILVALVFFSGLAFSQKRLPTMRKSPVTRATKATTAAAVTPTVMPTAMPTTAELQSPSARSAAFNEILSANRVSRSNYSRYTQSFSQLPEGLQTDMIARSSQKYAAVYTVEPIHAQLIANARIVDRFKLFRITDIFPTEGSRNNWAYVIGSGFDSDCKVLFNNVQVESYYVEYLEFFPKSMAFKVPGNATLGSMHNVAVKDVSSASTTAVMQYKIVAPRGYRGYWGWQFSNFSNNNIPWEMYRDYFGASNVEYSNGTHKPAAQSWFDNAYTKAGGGGNCYGMSMSSLRRRNGELNTYWHSWFDAAANFHNYLWYYPWQTETRQTVQEDQGAWYTQEVLDRHVDLWNNQSHRDCFNRANQLVGYWSNRPILVFWYIPAGSTKASWGHAVVPYKTEVAGDDRRIIVYDNNRPYRETETRGPDDDIATVHWAANTFSYGTANKAEVFSYDECSPAVPHLPGSEYGGPGSNTVALVLQPGTEANQITDEAGRKFFNPDGSLNQNPSTRIPNSAFLPPLVQRRSPLMRRGDVRQLQGAVGPGGDAPSVPSDAPMIYLFSNASGKSLTLDIAGQGPKSLALFQRGMVFNMQANGAGQLRMGNLLQATRKFELLNPGAMAPTKMDVTHSAASGDRVFELNGLQSLGAQALVLTPASDGSSLNVEGTAGARFNLRLLGPEANGQRQVSFAGIAMQAGNRAVLSPDNWGNLGASRLNLQLRNLQNNSLTQQLNLRGQ